MAHFRSDLALVPLEDFTIEYVWDYMGRQVRGDKYRDLLKVHQEHFFQARTGITTFVNDGGKTCLFGFTSSSRKCSPEVFKKRWDRLGKELSPKAIKEPANKIYDLYNACSITIMHRGKRPLAKTSKKCMHQDHWKFDAAKFESPRTQRHRLLTQGTKPSVRETVQEGAACSLPQAVPAGAALGTGSPASQQGPARKRAAGKQDQVAALEARVAELTLKLAAEKIQAEDEKIKAAAALAKMETEMSELANEKIKADNEIKQVRRYAHAHLDMTRTVRGTLRPLDALLSTQGACVCIGTLWHTTSSPCRTLMHSWSKIYRSCAASTWQMGSST